MIKLEKQLYKELKKEWPHYIERIEPKYKGGIPDVLLENNGAIFVELKVGTLTTNSLGSEKVSIKIRTSQKLWHRKYTGKSYLLASVGDLFYLFKRENIKHLFDGMFHTEFILFCEKEVDNMKVIVDHLL